MLKPRHVVLGLALLLALIGDSWGQSQHQLPNEATKAQQRAPTDERGTPDQPLTVNVVPTAEQKADADKEKESAKLKAADDRKLIEYTGYLVLVGVVQFGVFILQLIAFSLQARYMRRAADEMRETTVATIQAAAATKDAADEALKHSHKVERAYISGGGVRARDFFDLSANGTPRTRETGEFEFHINNYGKTSGTLYKLAYGFCDEATGIPAVPAYTFQYRHNPIDPGRRGEPIARHRIPAEHKIPVVYGRFYYETIFGTCHSSGFIYRILPNVAPESIRAPSTSYIKEQDEGCEVGPMADLSTPQEAK